MNEKLQYATMLEIPVNTCNVTYKRSGLKRGRKKKAESPEEIKEKLLEKVNSENYEENAADTVRVEESLNAEAALTDTALPVTDEAETAIAETEDAEYLSAKVRVNKPKRVFKFSVFTAEIVAAIALVAIIFLTNAVYSDSAINVFMRRVFAPASATEKTYSDFTPVMRYSGDMTLNGGVVSYTGSGSVYAACDGTVLSVTEEADGTYTMTVAHSEKFSSRISGLKYAYLGKGDCVFGTIPVGYAEENGFSMCFAAEDVLLTDYRVENDAVIWAA